MDFQVSIWAWGDLFAGEEIKTISKGLLAIPGMQSLALGVVASVKEKNNLRPLSKELAG